jgi:hypothetical protein
MRLFVSNRDRHRAQRATARLACAVLSPAWGISEATEALRAPGEFTYDANGATTATLRAAESDVLVGEPPYTSLVFNGKAAPATGREDGAP